MVFRDWLALIIAILILIIGVLVKSIGLLLFFICLAVIYVLHRKGILKKLWAYLQQVHHKRLKENKERKERERREREAKKHQESIKEKAEEAPFKKPNNTTISTLPIDYVPRAEQGFSSKDADYTYRKIYITLIWLALPLMAVFRYKIGIRVLSSFNVMVAIILLMISLKITQFLLELNLADNGLIFTAFFILFIIGLRKPLVFALLVISILIAFALYGAYLGYSMGQEKAKILIEAQQDLNLNDAFSLMLIISILLIMRKIISFFYEKKGASVHSYYYGRSIFFLIFRRDWITNIIVEPLLVGFVGIVMVNSYMWYDYQITYDRFHHIGEERLAIGYILLATAIASCLVSIMQQYAIRDYHQDMRDVEHLSNEETQKQAEERKTEQTTYQARGISQK